MVSYDNIMITFCSETIKPLNPRAWQLYSCDKSHKSKDRLLERAQVQPTQTTASRISKDAVIVSGNRSASGLSVALIKLHMILCTGLGISDLCSVIAWLEPKYRFVISPG